MDFRENYSTKIDSGRERIGNRFLTTSSRVEASSSRERNSRRFVYLSGRAILGFSARFVPEQTFSRRKGCFCPPFPSFTFGAAKFVISEDNFGPRDIAAFRFDENESRPTDRPLLKGDDTVHCDAFRSLAGKKHDTLSRKVYDQDN